MLYRILRFIFKIAIRIFFRKRTIIGKENIPSTGPLIIVANHPATFSDPIVIAAQIKRQVHFLAKAEIFKSGFSKWFLPKLNIIPVYRKDDDPTLMHKNEETFSKVYEILEQGGVVIIFPEGISETNRILRKIKTGAARMAFGAEEKNNFNLGVKIVPVGLNYENPHQFRQNVLMKITKPISIMDFREAFLKDNMNAVEEMRSLIRERLMEATLLAVDEEEDELLGGIRRIYKKDAVMEAGLSTKNPKDDFEVSRAISERISYFHSHEPERFERVRNKIGDYFKMLAETGLSERMVRNHLHEGFPLVRILISVAVLFFGFPFFVFGMINNYIAYMLPYWIYKKMNARQDYKGPIMMSVGIFTFPLFYAIQILLFYKMYGSGLYTLYYAISLPISGFFAFYYMKRASYLNNYISLKWYLLVHRKEARELISLRKSILGELEEGKRIFERNKTAVHIV